MRAKRIKIIVRAGIVALAVVVVFSLMIGAGGEVGEAAGGAESRQWAVMHITGPDVEGSYVHGTLPAGGMRVIDLDFSIAAASSSGEPNDPWGMKPAFSEIAVVKEFDKASPQLAVCCAAGQRFGCVYIRLLPGGSDPDMADPYYEIQLEDAVITKITDRVIHRETGDYAHLEEVSFKCRVIRWTEMTTGITAGWDVVSNQVQ